MKKLLGLVAVLIFSAFALSACGLLQDKKNPEENVAATEEREIPQIILWTLANEERLLAPMRLLKIETTFMASADDLSFLKFINSQTGLPEFPKDILDKFDPQIGLYPWAVQDIFLQGIVLKGYEDYVFTSTAVVLHAIRPPFHINTFLATFWKQGKFDRIILRISMLPNPRFDTSDIPEILFEGSLTELFSDTPDHFFGADLGVAIFPRPLERHITVADNTPSILRGGPVSFSVNTFVYLENRTDRPPFAYGYRTDLEELFSRTVAEAPTSLPEQFFTTGTITENHLGSPVYVFGPNGDPFLAGIVSWFGPYPEIGNVMNEGDITVVDFEGILRYIS